MHLFKAFNYKCQVFLSKKFLLLSVMYEIYPIFIFVLLNFIAAASNVMMYIFFNE